MSRLDLGPQLNMHKLTNVEAQRIMLILEETFLKLSLLSCVQPGVTLDESVLPELVGLDVHQVLSEQAVLEQQYESISNPGNHESTRGLPDFETLDDELRHSSRVVARMVLEVGLSAPRRAATRLSLGHVMALRSARGRACTHHSRASLAARPAARPPPPLRRARRTARSWTRWRRPWGCASATRRWSSSSRRSTS